MRTLACAAMMLVGCSGYAADPIDETQVGTGGASGDGGSEMSGGTGGAPSAPDGGTDSSGGSAPLANSGGAGHVGGSGGSGVTGPRCDHISSCTDLVGPCAISVSSVTCGDVGHVYFECGDPLEEKRGYFFEDGTELACDGSGGIFDCSSANAGWSAHCQDLNDTDGSGGSGTGGSDTGTGGSCTAWSYFEDADEDGFGNPDVGSCVALPGYVENDDDCYDENALAYPRELDPLMSTDHWELDRGDGSWDYDCDGEESPFWTQARDGCSQESWGWIDEVPACGVSHKWGTANCGALIDQIQRCR